MSYLWLINPITLLIIFICYAKTTGIVHSIFKYFGALLDFIVNVTWFTIIFWDIPKEWLLTKRIERLYFNTGYRGLLARLLAKLINTVLPDHINA